MQAYVPLHTDSNILIDNNCTDDELQFGMPGGSKDYEDDGDKIDQSDAIPTTTRQCWAPNEPERFALGTNDVDGYEADDGDDADVDEEEVASQGDDGSTQNMDE